MRIMVSGSRRWTDEKAIRMALFPWFFMEEAITLVTGGAKGADTIAEKMACDVLIPTIRSLGGDVTLTVEKFRPQYRHDRTKEAEAWNRVAPLHRNLTMLDSKPDVVLAFLLGKPGHGGTQHTIAHAQARGIPVWIVNYPEPGNTEATNDVQADEGRAA